MPDNFYFTCMSNSFIMHAFISEMNVHLSDAVSAKTALWASERWDEFKDSGVGLDILCTYKLVARNCVNRAVSA